MRRRLSLVVAVALGCGCGDGTGTEDFPDASIFPIERSLTIQPYLYACDHADVPRFCMYAVEDSVERRFPYWIPGFEFRWGTYTDVTVLEYEGDDALDAPEFDYELVSIDGERMDPVGTVYEVELQYSGNVFYPTEIPGVVNFVRYRVACEPTICDELLAWDRYGVVSCELTGDADVPLRALAIGPS